LNGEIAERFLPRLAPDVAFVHFQGIDFASHYYLYFKDSSQYASVPLDASCRERLDTLVPEYRRTLTAFTRYVDDRLGRLMAVLPADTAVMVLSDHGFDPVANCHTPGGHRLAPPGILVMSGPGIRAETLIEGASLYDVFPTLAASLGLPLANDLRGHPLDAAFTHGLLGPGSIRIVNRHTAGEPFHPEIATPGPVDPELELRLRSLGYLQ
jgi:arylsulfatase A-like enzyme